MSRQVIGIRSCYDVNTGYALGAGRQRPHGNGKATNRHDQPLIGIVLIEDGQEVTRYFVDEAEADAAVASQTATAAHSLAGAWSDLDWKEFVTELERIRRESVPTPPIDDL
jgi:hypothetical protein